MVLLTSSNACELSYTQHDPIGEENQLLHSLAEDVDEKTTAFPVETKAHATCRRCMMKTNEKTHSLGCSH